MKKSLTVLLAVLLAVILTGIAWTGYGVSEQGREALPVPEEADPIPPEEILQDYFGTILGIRPGTAGASLRTADAACMICSFAARYDLADADPALLRACMLKAMAELTEEERSLLRESFLYVTELLEESFADADVHRALYEDAGTAERMAVLLKDEDVQMNWEKLKETTCSLLGCDPEGTLSDGA